MAGETVNLLIGGVISIVTFLFVVVGVANWLQSRQRNAET